MRVHRHPLAGAVFVAATTSYVALRCLRPKRELRPAPAEPTAYFTQTEIDRARAFRRPQVLLLAANLATSGGVLALAALFPPKALRRALRRAGTRPLIGAGGVGAGLALALTVVSLPLLAVAHRRSVRAGLSTQDFGSWLLDASKQAGLGALAGGAAAGAAVTIIRRFPRSWWLVLAAAATLASGLVAALAPVVIQPLFNRFTSLTQGGVADDVFVLARRAGVDVGGVFSVDASRRTSAANAYVAGLSKTKRVVLYDTLLERLSEPEIRSVVAHELAHVKHRDLWRGLAFTALVTPGAVLVVKKASDWLTVLGSRRRATFRSPSAVELLPGIALCALGVSVALGIASNALSRAVEASADAFALDLTGDPDAAVSLERSLTTQNLAEPAPRRLFQLLAGSHPTPIERIGLAVAWQKCQTTERAEGG